MRELGPDVFWARIEAPLIAQARRPGQFIILSINNDYSERIPLTIAGANPADGTIELIWQRVGKTTAELAGLNEGDEIANISGPLGTPTYIANFGTVVCVGGGIGAAPLLPIATALKSAGNRVVSQRMGRLGNASSSSSALICHQLPRAMSSVATVKKPMMTISQTTLPSDRNQARSLLA